ncbi:MAG: hypothetical protein LBK66_13300 [Spirochaetaceae bacterium]|nr:hypothetical protein [Spirochaetaceae bacterium]
MTYYNGIVIPIAEGICKDNSNLEFTSNLDGVYEEYLKQKALIKLLVKNANDGAEYTLLDRHKIAACLTTAVMKTQLLHPDNIDDANNDYSLLESSRVNAQLAFLTGLNIIICFMIEENPSLKETFEDFKLPKPRYQSTYLDSTIRALYFSDVTSGFSPLLLSNIFFLLEEYHKLSCSLTDKNISSGKSEKQ